MELGASFVDTWKPCVVPYGEECPVGTQPQQNKLQLYHGVTLIAERELPEVPWTSTVRRSDTGKNLRGSSPAGRHELPITVA